jgi:hypothetical protein
MSFPLPGHAPYAVVAAAPSAEPDSWARLPERTHELRTELIEADR